MNWEFDRQGWTFADCGDITTSNQHLPQVSALGEDKLFKHIENTRILPELLWPYEVSQALNAAVNPDTYAVAERVVRCIQDNSSALLLERIKGLHNKVVHGQWQYTSHPFWFHASADKLLDLWPGQKINYKLQVAQHWDGKNWNLLDCVFICGRNFKGGWLLFGSLGVSLCADPGYSIHFFF